MQASNATARRAVGTGSWFVSGIALVLVVGGACGDSDNKAEGEAKTPVACTVDPECDDQDPCTIDSCGDDKLCTTEPAPDGDAAKQEQGDCSRTVCQNGVASQVPDTGDVEDDEEQCTLDVCNGGKPEHIPMLDNTVCRVGRGQGSCQDGKCIVLCTPTDAATQCDDQNPCTSDACLPCELAICKNKGQCDHAGLSGMPTPGAPQRTGDCHEQRCVEGKDTDAVDNYDVPADAGECSKGACKLGVPLQEPLPARTECRSSGRLCDGEGECVDCLAASDCPDESAECYQPACNNNSCSREYTPSGTPLPADRQEPGDCRVVTCNGSGSSTSSVDNADLPSDDNDCTEDRCVSGSPDFQPVAVGTSCGGTNVCDPYGRCCTPRTCTSLGRECGPLDNNCGQTVSCGECPLLGDYCVNGLCCTPESCADQGRSCGTTSDNCGHTLACGTCAPGDYCSGSGVCGCANGYRDGSESDVDCGGGICETCAQGLRCNVDGDCESGACADGVCCSSSCVGVCRSCLQSRTGQPNGTCAHVADGTDLDYECDVQPATSCGTTGVCKGGACETHPSGTVCVAASCATGTSQNRADTCNGLGACVDNGVVACDSPYACVGTACQSCSDGVRNGNETDVDCGGQGACSACVAGKLCNTGTDCASTNCVDGRCCGTVCDGLCVRCDITGHYGTCWPIPPNQDPDLECPGNNTCDGAGACM